MISQKDDKFVSMAKDIASQSNCLQKHGCICVLNNRQIIGAGCNNSRTYSSDKLIKNCMTCHAEIAAIRECNRHFKYYGNYKAVGPP